MSINRKYVFPDATYGQKCTLVAVDTALVPIVTGALSFLLEQYPWQTRQDYEKGYNAISEVIKDMANNCMQEFVESNRQIYRLLDTVFNGRQYISLEDGTISPPIAAVPDASTNEANAMRAHIGRLWHLAENAATAAEFAAGSGIEGAAALTEDLSWAKRILAVQGETGGFLGIGEVPVQLKDLLKASRINTPKDKENIGSALDTFSDAISIGDNIKDAITDFLGGAAELGTDGGVIAVQLAVGAAQVQLLRRLIRAVDGAEILTPPTDNLLFALRGDTPATSDRNALDYLRKIALTSDGEWEAGNLLQQIRDKIDGLRDAISGPDDAGSLSLQLLRLETLLRGLVDTDDTGAPVVGPTLQLVNDILNCICEGVSGTVSQYPTPESLACPDLTHLALVANVTFAENGLAFEEGGVYPYARFTLQPNTTTTFPVTIFGGNPGFRVVGPRNLCIGVALPIGTVNPGISGVFTPLRINDGGSGARPPLSLDETPSDTVGFFEDDASDNGEPIAYTMSISAPAGTLIGVTARIYIFDGALG